MNALRASRAAGAALLLLLVASCGRESTAVTYANVQPIFDQYCVSCHKPGQPGYEASGFDVRSYDAIMKGTRFGPVVVPGDPQISALVMLIEGRADPSIKMPHGDAAAPSDEQLATIRRWVEQGARFE